MRIGRFLCAFAFGSLTLLFPDRRADAQTIPPVGNLTTGSASVTLATASNPWWLPLRGATQDDSETFYSQQRQVGFIPQVRWFTEGLADETEGSTNTLSADLLSEVIGPLRLALGSAVTSATDTETAMDAEATLQQISRGGNLYVNAAFPVIRYPDWRSDKYEDAAFRAVLLALPQLSAVVPEFTNGAAESTVYAGDIAAEGYVEYGNKIGGLFASARTGPIFLSDTFATQRGDDVSRRFWLTQWSAGMQLWAVRVSFQGLLGAADVQGADRSARLVFQILPRQD